MLSVGVEVKWLSIGPDVVIDIDIDTLSNSKSLRLHVIKYIILHSTLFPNFSEKPVEKYRQSIGMDYNYSKTESE